MPNKASAEGRREVYSLTLPVTAEKRAMSQWKKGGLKATEPSL